MSRVIDDLFSSAAFAPHGFCMLWRPDLVALHAISDGVIALSYFSIPVAIYLFVSQRRDFEFRWVAHLFVAFIALCGMTHLAALVTLWEPYYGVQGMIKAATAVVSIATALSLWPLLPKVLAVPSPVQLQDVNRRLEEEISRHRQTEKELLAVRDQLEDRVRDRTRELEAALAAQQAAERQLAAHAAELERSNRDLDDFAHIASHDLKEPIRGIANSATFFLEDHGGGLPPQARAQVETIIRLAKRLDRFLNDLLTYSRYGRTEQGFRSVDMGALVAGIIEELRPALAGEGGRVVVAGPLPTVHCDRTRMGEVFRNLITNGVKYNDGAAKLVEVGVEDADSGVDGVTTFYVKDNGIGIAPEHRERVFGMFKRLHGRDAYGGGTGAGLSIVKKIVERHNGRIWAAANPDGGTIIRFTLTDPRRDRHGPD